MSYAANLAVAASAKVVPIRPRRHEIVERAKVVRTRNTSRAGHDTDGRAVID
jgi:hypothetical protein